LRADGAAGAGLVRDDDRLLDDPLEGHGEWSRGEIGDTARGERNDQRDGAGGIGLIGGDGADDAEQARGDDDPDEDSDHGRSPDVPRVAQA
jgi:hypothetical protein